MSARGINTSERPALTLLHGREAPVEWSWFCGHCAAPSPGGEAPAPNARVCSSCGLGLLLEARGDVAPQAGDTFLVVDSALLVQAMSVRAEAMLGLREDLAVNRPLTELLVPADAEADAPAGLAIAITEAVAGGEAARNVFVRPWNTFGVRLPARISTCGPPRAALVVLDGSHVGALRAVKG